MVDLQGIVVFDYVLFGLVYVVFVQDVIWGWVQQGYVYVYVSGDGQC